MKFKMKLPVVVDVEFTVQTEDNDESYRIVGLNPPSAAAFKRALSAEDAETPIVAEIATRKLARKGLVG